MARIACFPTLIKVIFVNPLAVFSWGFCFSCAKRQKLGGNLLPPPVTTTNQSALDVFAD
ncbi:hypothetical protein [Chroococcidiopsis sp. TS-821]|uniref:hypothetical protein n=1 Tax=Chroococcidiopsis sp. TS-821 TaxID=1378066 RepID=UPI00143CE521|nr:hypothetical protein [Chroococcidiopsis sp. TS-821]